MSNVKRLGQEYWLVDNVKFASGQRTKRRLFKSSLIRPLLHDTGIRIEASRATRRFRPLATFHI